MEAPKDLPIKEWIPAKPPKLPQNWLKKRKPLTFYMERDPDLVAPKAYEHPEVYKWWRWLLEHYQPRAPALLFVEPQRTRPHTRSPSFKRYVTALSMLGAWDPVANKPNTIEIGVLSVLLGFIPYDRGDYYPACCYMVDVYDIFSCSTCYSRVFTILYHFLQRLAVRGVRVAGFLVSRPIREMLNDIALRLEAADKPRPHIIVKVSAGTSPKALTEIAMEIEQLLEKGVGPYMPPEEETNVRVELEEEAEEQ